MPTSLRKLHLRPLKRLRINVMVYNERLIEQIRGKEIYVISYLDNDQVYHVA